MNLMFSYPIKRQKILASQMIAVWMFNLAAWTLTKLFIYSCIGRTDADGIVSDRLLAGNLIFPAILTAVSFVFAVRSVFHAEKKDLQ